MGVLDLVHRFSVLVSVASYALPLYEGLQRRSAFYTLVFGGVLCVSSLVHCEESGVCAAYAPATHERLATLSSGLSLYLGGLMALVVLEIRAEVVGRALMGLWALAATARDAGDTATNAGVTVGLAALLLAADVAAFKRRFTPAWWKRLGLILAMAGCGYGLFELIHVSTAPESHAIFHVYLSACCYLLLLAQRTKRALAARGGAKRPGGPGAAVSSGVAHSYSTPTKRRGGGSGEALPAGAAATSMGGLYGGEGDGGDPRAAHKEPGSVA